MATVVGHADVCGHCVGDVDDDHHVYNPSTGEVFCSADCWAEGVLG